MSTLTTLLRLQVFAQLVTLVALAGPTLAVAQPTCAPVPTPGSGRYGPFDFRTDKDKLQAVESFHFTPQVESLIRGATTGIGGDLHYTLDKFPNHHRALLSTVRLAARTKNGRPEHMEPVECYFVRAIAFRKDDTVVRTMFALYLSTAGRKAEALDQLNVATQLAKDNPFTHQSIGLAYLDLGEQDKALERGLEVQRLGFPSSELIARLKKAGRWSEPVAETASSAASPAAASGVSRTP
jgi:hypothetical protein